MMITSFIAYVISYVTTFLHSIKPYYDDVIAKTPRPRDRPGDDEPFLRHQTIHANQLVGKDLLIIGDVHGCYDEMVALVTNTAQTTERPLVVVLVGDFIRKGPESLRVLRHVRMTSDFYSVRGNHEQKVVTSLVTTKREHSDVTVTKSLSSTDLDWINTMTSEDLKFLTSLSYTISLPSLGVVVVHAGLIPGQPLSTQPADVMMTMRKMTYGDDMFHGSLILRPCYHDNEEGRPWARHWYGPDHVYFGHDAAAGYQDYQFATGLDTGCVYGGFLTGVHFRLVDDVTTVRCKSRNVVRVKATKSYRAVKNRA